ncbi:hypothetical protein PFICI_06277 [Pestalotiopsis fici W106-1]|uniref:Heterokaryon incompatibility domain-containing protein n=1 Tax=Pestalotiopsis fici (strain W106-1 / CGMCC3.15140) TaxID=1229662 RepID=W3X5F2_PESFW|nr:uncharacterized protein PFICI_06277 [Pestalotiopsis fici W106-1]ETS81275.1 hypothetical protein PFICI_06277 [Pestalotiopsis fici W106-1]
MRLINVSVDSLVVESGFDKTVSNLTYEVSRWKDQFERQSSQLPPYAILSHRWVGEEVVYPDLKLVSKSQLQAPGPTNPVPKTAAGADENVGPDTVASVYKIAGACETVRAMNPEINHIWIDTVCINKQDIRELSAAMNSMFKWYQNSEVCYVYLFDVTWNAAEDPVGSHEQFRTSQWFERGWTLQELLAPRQVWFFDRDWRYMGTKEELADDITQATGISHEHLLRDFRTASTAQKMGWLARRRTTYPEDISYCALGLFNVFLDPRYGLGGEKEFLRLQREIFIAGTAVGAQLDESLFAWTAHTIKSSGLLAPPPLCFLHAGDVLFEPGLVKSRQDYQAPPWRGIDMDEFGNIEIRVPWRPFKRFRAAMVIFGLAVFIVTAGLASVAYQNFHSSKRRTKNMHLINLNCWTRGPDGRLRTADHGCTESRQNMASHRV